MYQVIQAREVGRLELLLRKLISDQNIVQKYDDDPGPIMNKN